MEQLQPGALIKIGERKFEYVGVRSDLKEGEEPQIVGRINPEKASESGVLHAIFPLSQIEKDGVKVGPFGEKFPYSIYREERQVWEKKFPGVGEAMPYPPQELVDVLLRAKEKGIETLVPHFSPEMHFSQDAILITIDGEKQEFPYPANWVKLSNDFFDYVREGKMVRMSLKVPSQWFLIDTTQRTTHSRWALRKYIDDPFEKNIIDLEVNNFIGVSGPAGTRYNLSYDEVKNHVLPAIAVVLETDPHNISVPTVAEFNVIGNLFNPEFGQRTAGEWLLDDLKDGQQLTGGFPTYGGVGQFRPRLKTAREKDIGFRPIVVFPAK